MQQITGFINSRFNRFFVENDHELVVFVQACAHYADAEDGIENCDEFISVLNEQIGARFSRELHVVPIDAQTGKPADEFSPLIHLSIEPKQKIVRQ
jgi:hypothetical protein